MDSFSYVGLIKYQRLLQPQSYKNDAHDAKLTCRGGVRGGRVCGVEETWIASVV